MLKLEKYINEDGQALFEFIAFLPFLLMLYSITLTISNSLNASINQQKSTRSYFYYLNQNNSRFPSAERPNNFSSFSMSIIGWADYYKGRTPVAPCFELQIPIGDIEGDECEEAYSDEKTQFIRVGTVYGVCGASYLDSGNGIVILPYRNAGTSNLLVPKDPIAGCSLRK